MARAVEVRDEGDAVLVDVGQAWLEWEGGGVRLVAREHFRHLADAVFESKAEAEDLVAPAVGHERPRPRHKSVQTTHPGDLVRAGPQIEMIGIRQHDLDAHLT